MDRDLTDLGEYTQEDLDMVCYFHETFGDHTRFCHWDRIKDSVKRDFPKLFVALDNLELAQDNVDAQFRNLEVYDGS